MKIALAVIVVLLACFFAFAYFHSKSIDRARLVNSVNDLLTARLALQQHGSITDTGIAARVYAFTNQVIVSNTTYVAELATDVSGMLDMGRLIGTADGTAIWIDDRSGPVIVRSHDGDYWHTPSCFRDFPWE